MPYQAFTLRQGSVEVEVLVKTATLEAHSTTDPEVFQAFTMRLREMVDRELEKLVVGR